VAAVKLDRGVPRVEDRIRIATFDIQAFDAQKVANPNVMQTIAAIISNFDLVAIQGVRSPEAMPVARVVDLINRSGGKYSVSMSEPVGNPGRKEQYAFVWDTNRIRMIPDTNYSVRDDADRMVREPYVASFETRTAAAQGLAPFRFTIINAHIDPDETSPAATMKELSVLDDVFVRVREFEYTTRGEDDVILVGNLNVDARNLGELGQIPGIVSIAGNQPTTTDGTKTVDHILIDRSVTSEFSTRYGVVDYQKDFGLTREQALMISDHRPVWAEFSVTEIPAFTNVAQQAPAVR
jgi:deoxyribonuclease-1-like protein